MNTFQQVGKKAAKKTGFTGAKVSLTKVLNRQIVINAYRIGPSNFEGERLDLDITLGDENRLLWTGRKSLIESIQTVAMDAFPITATIVFEDEQYQFE